MKKKAKKKARTKRGAVTNAERAREARAYARTLPRCEQCGGPITENGAHYAAPR